MTFQISVGQKVKTFSKVYSWSNWTGRLAIPNYLKQNANQSTGDIWQLRPSFSVWIQGSIWPVHRKTEASFLPNTWSVTKDDDALLVPVTAVAQERLWQLCSSVYDDETQKIKQVKVKSSAMRMLQQEIASWFKEGQRSPRQINFKDGEI